MKGLIARSVFVSFAALISMATTAFGQVFDYQARLTDGGVPANGIYSPIFTLWDAASNGNQIGPPNIFEGLLITDGLFTVPLNFGAGAFNGQDRWLEISVGGQTLTPRQQVRPTPYAMYALNVADSAVPFTYSGGNAVFTGGNVGIGTTNPQRLLDMQAGEAMLRLTATDPTAGRTSRLQFKGSAGPSLFHPMGFVEFYDENETLRSTISSTKAGGTAAQMHFNVTPGQVAQLMIGSGLVRAYDKLELRRSTDLELAAEIGTNGSDSFFQLQGGYFGIATDAPNSMVHIGTDDSSTIQLGSNPQLMLTRDTAANKFRIQLAGGGYLGNILQLGRDDGNHDIAMTGDVGIGTSSPIAKLHVNRVDSGTVLRAQGSGSGTGLSLSGNSIGVQVNGLSSTGTAFQAPSITGSARAASFYGNSSNDLLRVQNDGSGVAAKFIGQVDVDVLQITGGSDLSEMFDVGAEASVQPGMVVSIDPDNPGQLIPSSVAYDSKVAGVVSGAGDVATGMTMGHDGTIADGDYPVALTGRVYCYVDATDHAVEPGDLLTTSSMTGHAMRATERGRSHGAVIGKAMTSLGKGETGLVLVLINLH